MEHFPVVIHHNPDCATSCSVLDILYETGHDPVVIEYLQGLWTRPQLLAIFAAANLTPRTALRVHGSPATEIGLLEEGVTDEQIFAAMLVHPILVNRPIVATPKGIKLCRPKQIVYDLL